MLETSPINMLKDDHREVMDLFNQFEATPTEEFNKRKEVVDKVCDELEIHTELEEKYFYPEIAQIGEGVNYAEESLNDHEDMKELIKELKEVSPESTFLEAKFIDLKNLVKSHVDREEDQIFPFAEQNMEDKLGVTLAAKMLADKEKMKIQKKIY